MRIFSDTGKAMKNTKALLRCLVAAGKDFATRAGKDFEVANSLSCVHDAKQELFIKRLKQSYYTSINEKLKYWEDNFPGIGNSESTVAIIARDAFDAIAASPFIHVKNFVDLPEATRVASIEGRVRRVYGLALGELLGFRFDEFDKQEFILSVV